MIECRSAVDDGDDQAPPRWGLDNDLESSSADIGELATGEPGGQRPAGRWMTRAELDALWDRWLRDDPEPPPGGHQLSDGSWWAGRPVHRVTRWACWRIAAEHPVGPQPN
jgi:hypothetical protein